MINVAIIDDEILAISLLENIIKDMVDVNVVGKFTSFAEGLDQIEKLNPDVIFLDIEMPGENGIRVAEWINEMDKKIDIVFVTAYDQYALEAFGVHAVDYLLKPVARERLEKTLLNIMKKRDSISPVVKKSKLQFKAQFLGNFILFNVHNQPVKWRTKKVKELCAYLLHHHKVSVHKDQILEDLWPTLSMEKAKNHLHTSVYQLRKEFKKQGFEEAIQYIDERYKLDIDIKSDIHQLLAILDRSTIEEQVIQTLLELYKDDYLAEDDYLWSTGTSSHLRKKVKMLLEQSYKLFPNQIFSRKILESLIELEPLEESYRQLLMRYFIQQEKSTEALHCYVEFEKMLWDEMSEKPKQNTRKIVIDYL